ncbi:ribonuclease Z [Paludibacter sp. 221]|uniref:ribonuclease Z n=1 Tax=Paludibacter sp. 221 TaxID=2302939 RepID=UPI0013D4EC16|nr:ribonuclease Z [Paludibacter sp. 221]NDV47728.1 ribonuclease Z [Paludibacter sp. 221]
MQNAQLTILGCGSALPTKRYFPSAQILTLREKSYLIDCGEGTQIRLRQMKVTNTRFGHVFISHLHGDHCFGLVGMISSFGMLNRTADLHIHAHADLQRLLTPMLQYFCADLPFKVIFHHVDPEKHQLIFEDRSVSVYSIPLKHRVPTCGFLFEEKPKERNIIREMIDFYQIPVSYIHKIKQGEDFVTTDGETIPNTRLTTPPKPPKRFAYCSDTAYNEKIIPIIEGVDCLYHEATFAEEELVRAGKTMHCTARQTAEIAQKANVKKLIIGHYSARYSNPEIIYNEAKAVFANTIAGEDMKTYEF